MLKNEIGREIVLAPRGLAFESFKGTAGAIGKGVKRNSNTLNFNNLNILVDTGRREFDGGKGKRREAQVEMADEKANGKERRRKRNVEKGGMGVMMESWAADGRETSAHRLGQIYNLLKNLQCNNFIL